MICLFYIDTQSTRTDTRTARRRVNNTTEEERERERESYDTYKKKNTKEPKTRH